MMKGGTDRRSVPRVPSLLRFCAALAAVGLLVSSPSTQLAYDQDLKSPTPRLEDAKTTAEGRDGASSRLVAAVRKNNLATVRALLAEGVDPNTVDATATPVLVRAAGSGRTTIVGVLLDAGADPNATAPVDEDRDGWPSALMAAAGEGHLDVVELLLARGVDVNARFEDASFVPTPLLAAVASGRAEVVRALLVAGADISAKGAMGIQAIHEAALEGDPEIVELLLASGAEVDARDGLSGGTPLMWAAQAGHVKTVRLLIARGANVNARDDEARRAFAKAEFVGDTATMREIKRSGRLAFVIEDGASVLDHAKIGGNQEVVRVLLAAGAARRK